MEMIFKAVVKLKRVEQKYLLKKRGNILLLHKVIMGM